MSGANVDELVQALKSSQKSASYEISTDGKRVRKKGIEVKPKKKSTTSKAKPAQTKKTQKTAAG